jgi:hypothetical protein
MSISKLDIGVVERIAPSRGPTSSADYNATNQEIMNALTQVALSWNNELHTLVDSLPSGGTEIIRENRTSNPNPYINGLDGSQLYLDMTSTTLTDDGRYYDDTLARPLTIKESIESVQDKLNSSIQDLLIKIAQISTDSGLSIRQKQAIGSRIFDPETTSAATSLDGTVKTSSRNIDQIALDISGDANYLKETGVRTLNYAILQQLEAIQNAHDYDQVHNEISHAHLNFHEHRYNVTPIGNLDGTNREYYTPGAQEFVADTLRVIVNGIELRKSHDFIEHANRKGFTIIAPHRALENDSVGADDNVWIHYDLEIV